MTILPKMLPKKNLVACSKTIPSVDHVWSDLYILTYEFKVCMYVVGCMICYCISHFDANVCTALLNLRSPWSCSVFYVPI